MYRGKGVGIGGSIEVKGSPEKMFYGVGGEELLGRSSVPAYLIEGTADMIGCPDDVFVDVLCFISVFISHFKSVVRQFPEGIVAGADDLIAHVDLSVKGRKVDIDPVRVFGGFPKERGILNDICVRWVFKGVRITGHIKSTVLPFREFYLEIASGPGRRSIFTCSEKE